MNGNGTNGTVSDMQREIRNLGHQKQDRMQVQQGIPNTAELSEGVPVLRSVAGVGIVQYLKYNGDMYASVFTKSLDTKMPQESKKAVSLLYDDAALGTGAVGQDWATTMGATISNIIVGDWEHHNNDLGSIAAKINEIIRALRKAGIISQSQQFLDSGS